MGSPAKPKCLSAHTCSSFRPLRPLGAAIVGGALEHLGEEPPVFHTEVTPQDQHVPDLLDAFAQGVSSGTAPVRKESPPECWGYLG